MFQLDDKFLQEVGLDGLPEEQKKEFLQHIYGELELRVGTKLSEGMSEEQLTAFEAFVDQDEQKVVAWFEKYLPNYRELEDYQSLRASAPADVTNIMVLSEYGSLKWLEINRPDYKQVVASEMAALKSEITQNRDAILGTGI